MACVYKGVEVSKAAYNAIPAFFDSIKEKCGSAPDTDTEVRMALFSLEEIVSAATMSQSLMESNTELSDRFNSTVTDYAKQIDVLNQQIHVLQLDLKHANRDNESIAGFHEQMKVETQREKDEWRAEIDIKQREMVRLKSDLSQEAMQNALDKEEADLTIKQLNYKLVRLEESIQQQQDTSRTNEINDIKNNESLEQAFEELAQEYRNTSAEVETLHGELENALLLVERLELSNQNLANKCEVYEAEVEEKGTEIENVYSILAESRTRISTLQTQLDNNGEHRKTTHGKSILTDIEDQRADLEIRLKDMTTQFDARRRMHEALKHQYLRLQRSMAAALALSANRSNTALVGRLEQALSQKEGEIQSLTSKLGRALEKQAHNTHADLLRDKYRQNNGNDEYVNYIETQLEIHGENESALRKEVSMAQLKLVSASNKLKDTQSALSREEIKNDQLASENVGLKLKMEELKMHAQTPIGGQSANGNADANTCTSTNTQSHKQQPRGTTHDATSPLTLSQALSHTHIDYSDSGRAGSVDLYKNKHTTCASPQAMRNANTTKDKCSSRVDIRVHTHRENKENITSGDRHGKHESPVYSVSHRRPASKSKQKNDVLTIKQPGENANECNQQ
eukprot:CFRG7406T1